jgi:hypothetical protein
LGTFAFFLRVVLHSVDVRMVDPPVGQGIQFARATLLRSRTTPGLWEDLNTTGIAMAVAVDVGGQARYVLFPGDAGFSDFVIPPLLLGNLRAMTAPHHGGHTADGAADVLAPMAPPPGRVAYSYGIMLNGNHCYGHPLAVATALYQGANWTRDKNTAEDDARTGAVAQRGNILIGNINPALGDRNVPCACAPACSFQTFRAQKMLPL